MANGKREKVNPFQNFTESFFSPIGGAVRGTLRGLLPGAAEQHDLQKQRIQSLLKSDKAQRLITKARAASLDRGEGYYGGRGTTADPYVKGAEDLGKIRKARDTFLGEFGDEKLDPETAAYFDAAEQSVLDRTKSLPKTNRATDFVGPPAPPAT